MGYFSNGDEGLHYAAKYCERCVHGDDPDVGCEVWLAHLLYNYDDCNNPKSILHLLIPRSRDGLGNEQCRMFVEAGEVEKRLAEQNCKMAVELEAHRKQIASREHL